MAMVGFMPCWLVRSPTKNPFKLPLIDGCSGSFNPYSPIIIPVLSHHFPITGPFLKHRFPTIFPLLSTYYLTIIQ